MGDVFGAITQKTGAQNAMKGWAVASFERDTGIARVGEVNDAGLFTLQKVRSSSKQTLALFTPDYILHSVLSIPATASTVKQFITMNSEILPLLINNGPILSFQNYDGLTIAGDVAADADGDGIPDGAKDIQGLSLAAPAKADTDRDGIFNDRDPDIDGDGVINVLDPDDDGDGVFDAFDGDANADYTADTTPGQENTDLYFKEGVEYISVQYEQTPKDNGTTETTLKFLTKVRNDVTPNTVQIRGAPTLLNSSTFQVADANSGIMIDQPWNRLLSDDGVSEDANPKDRIFAKRVRLADGVAPRSYEAVFFQLSFGPVAKPYFVEFPYVFPNLKPAAINAVYEAHRRIVILVGKPFGATVQDFVWIINLYNEEGVNVWNSQAVSGTTTEFGIPENQFEAGKSYKFDVVCQSLDKIPGHPSYVIHSLKIPAE